MRYLLFLLFSLSLQAKIVEIDTFSAFLNEVDQETLVFVDIDETLLTAPDCLGNTAWWKYYKAKLKSQKIDKEDPFWLKITRTIIEQMQIVPVEREAAHLIASLQMQGVAVLGLTARPLKAPWDQRIDHSFQTKMQLHSIGVDFTKSKTPTGVVLKNAPNHAFHIIFTTWQMKGPALLSFYDQTGFRPKKVIMVDDQHPQLLSLDQAHDQLGVPFTGFHYTRCSQQSRPFDPMIGNIQLKELLTKRLILTYEEALQIKQTLLKQNPHLSPDFFLEELLAARSKSR